LPEKKKDNEPNHCIQTKLTVGASDDPYEKEADSVADSIMRMPQQNFAQRKCAECEKEDQLQRKPIVETISDSKISRKLSVENPDGMIPNPTGSGVSQTNGQTLFDYINELCPDTDWMIQDGRIELLDTNFCFPSEAQEDGSFKSPSQLSAHPVSCECLCETSMDPLDNIIIRINDYEEGTGSTNDNAGGTIINVPSPNAKESKVMGASGTMVDSPPFIILAHELCGHHLLNRHGNDDENMLNDKRGGHDPTINRENEIRSEHGIDQRGTFRDPCCGLGDNSPEGMEGTTHPCGKKFEEGLTKHRRYAYECKHWRDEYNRLNGTSFAVEDAIPIVPGERVPAQWRIEVYFNVDTPQSWLTLNQSLTEEGRTNLGTVENLLTAHPDWQTQLAGNASTDRPANDPDYNTRLAKRRVIAIRDELLSRGVTNERMKTFDSDCETIQDGVHNCGDTIAEPRSNALDRNVEVKIFPPEQLQANNAAANSATPTTDNFIQRKCAHCEEEEKEQVQRKSFIQTKSETAAPSVSESLSQSIESSKGRGYSIDDSTQAFMSERFGADFTDVKIHTGSNAAQMNQQLNAKAFTTGNDIYFNEGQYQPHSDSGKQLLAHELTHTIQQQAVPEFLQKKDGDRSPDRKVKSLLLMQIKEEKIYHVRFNVLFTDGSTSAFEMEWDLQEGEELDIGKQYQIRSTGLYYEISSKQDPRKYSLTLHVTDSFGKKFYSYDLDKASSSDPVAQTSINDMKILNVDLAKETFNLDADIIDVSEVDKSGKEQKGFPLKSVKEKPVLNFSLPGWFTELKKKIEEKIAKDKETNKDNPYFPDKMYFYGSDKVQLKKGKDAWTIEVEKGNGEAYYTVLKKDWDEADDKEVFTEKTVGILYEKVQLILTRPPENDKEIYEIDGSGEMQNKFKDEGDKAKANPFSGLKKEELEKLKSLIKELTGDTKTDDKAAPPKVPLTSNDIKALLQLANDPNKEKIIAYLKSKTGDGVSSTKTIEELIAIAKLKDAYERFEIKTDSSKERQEPIVNRPVQGVIVQHDPLIVAHKPVSFQFEVRNDVDALRVPHIVIRWYAYTDPKKNDNSPAPKDWKEDDWVDYIPINDEGVMNRKHGKFEFPAEGIYTIEAIVDHNFFLPNLFRTSIKVLDEQKVLKEKEDKAYKGFLKEGTTTKEDFGELSYGVGTVTRGKIDEKFKGATVEEQLKVIDAEIDRIKGIIEEYRKKKNSEGDAMVEWGEKYLEKLQNNRNNIAKTNEDKSQNIIACRGTYVSRTEGVKTADLKLSCFIKKDINIIPPAGEFDEGSEEEGYRITLYDYTQLYENENYTISVFATTSEAAMKHTFSQLSEAYPEGHISLAFQKWDDAANKKTDEYIKYTRITDTIGKKIKKIAFSTPVNIAVNVVAAVLSVFPPTTGVGIAIGILYNGAQTISELQEQADKGTLTGKKVMIGCGSMLLDILPVLGTAGKAAKIVRVGTKAYYVVEGIQLAGQALLVYETGMEQVEKLRTDYFVKIAELDDEIAMLKDTNPSDPEIDVLEKQREKLVNDGRDATVKVLGEMAAQQVAFTVGGKLLHGIHEHYSAKSKLEARGKIADSLTGVEKLNEGERLALADKIYDNDIPIKPSKETGWKKEGDGWVLEIADNATHAEIDALLDKNPNAKTTAEPGTAKPASGEADASTTERKQVEKDAKAVSNSPIDAESKTPVTATNEVHEHLIHEDGTITRCSDRCAKLLDNTTDRAKEIQKLFGKEHGNTKKAKELKEKAKQLEKEAKDASKIKDKAERKMKEDEILSKAKQLELDLAVLEKAMVNEIDSRISKSMDDITAFLDKYPEYKGEFERRIKNRNERKKEIAAKLNDPDPTIKGEALDELKHEAELAKELLRDMQKHADNLTKPDISKRYNYYETTNKQGNHVKVAEGELGVPGEVMKHRSQTEQGKVSAGTGDDAGHLIANVFGAEGGGRNLGKQNWIANEFGTWRQLEIMWAEKLVNGTKVSVKVREVARAKGERPYMREATWTEIDPSGNVTHHSLTLETLNQ